MDKTICPNCIHVPFEEINNLEVSSEQIWIDQASDTDADFSGFSDLSEGDITRKLHLAEENFKAFAEIDCSAISDVSSAFLVDINGACGGDDKNIDGW